MKLKVLVRTESAGGYSVSVPALPGCHSEGETLEEARENLQDAFQMMMEYHRDETREHSSKTAQREVMELALA